MPRPFSESDRPSVEFPKAPGRHKQIVAQIDGGMVPVMEPDANQKDKRKGKKLSWKEAKISLAHAKGSRTPVYGGGIEGGVEAAGRRLFACAVRAGFGADSRVHAVGDGAPWIVGQIEELFGEQGSYLIDFYHVCEYLSAAAKTIAPNAAAGKAWMETQKDALKTGRVDEVLSALVPHREAPDVSDEQAPVRVCHRYLGARKDQLKYREALAEGLADRLWRNRKRASLCRAKAPEAPRRLVARRARGTHARAADQPPERRLGSLLGRARRQPARTRQSQPAKSITKCRRLIAQLWFAPASRSLLSPHGQYFERHPRDRITLTTYEREQLNIVLPGSPYV